MVTFTGFLNCQSRPNKAFTTHMASTTEMYYLTVWRLEVKRRDLCRVSVRDSVPCPSPKSWDLQTSLAEWKGSPGGWGWVFLLYSLCTCLFLHLTLPGCVHVCVRACVDQRTRLGISFYCYSFYFVRQILTLNLGFGQTGQPLKAGVPCLCSPYAPVPNFDTHAQGLRHCMCFTHGAISPASVSSFRHQSSNMGCGISPVTLYKIDHLQRWFLAVEFLKLYQN